MNERQADQSEHKRDNQSPSHTSQCLLLPPSIDLKHVNNLGLSQSGSV